ncbi:MAG: CHAT domain-containing tetratricopeptide repeat protein, partial [FCB group bacterium]
MKKRLILVIISLFILHSTFYISKAQTWQQMMDSTTYYQEKNDFQTAMLWAQKALPQAEKEFGKNDTNYAGTLGSIAILYFYSGKIDSAINYQENDLKISRTLFKDDSPDLAIIINNTGYIYENCGYYKQAEPLYIEALGIYRRIFKGDNPDLAMSINNMALFYNNRGNNKQAEPLFKEALEMRRRLFKSDHSDLAISIGNMGYYYVSIGDYKQAEPLYKEALEMKRRLYKKDNSYLAVSINNMGFLYNTIGDFNHAEPLYKEALEMYRRIYKGDHPDLAQCINNMAMVYYCHGEYSKAELLFKEALGMYRRLFKEDYPGLAQGINNMAYYFEARGDYKQAEPLYRESLEMYRRIYKGDHPDLATILNNMALFYNNRGNNKQAEPLFKETLEMRRKLFKCDQPELAISIGNMAYYYNSICDYKLAGPLYKEAMDMKRRLYKDDHPGLAQSINNMAYFYNERGEYDKAEPLYKEAFEMYSRLYKAGNPDFAQCTINMAVLYEERSDYKKAEAMYKDGLQMERDIFSCDHPALAQSINNMAYFLEGRGEYKNAEPLYLEALQVNQNMLNNYFPSLSEIEKKQFWATVSNDFEGFNSFAIKRIKDNPSITGKLYDIQLYSKALLFNSSSRIRSRVMNSNDDTLIANYKHWLDLKEFILKCWSKPSKQLEKEKINLDSLENLANDYEKAISLKSEIYAKNFEKKKIGWNYIPMALQPGEAAIEIIRFRLRHGRKLTDTIYYAALIITEQTTEYPDIVVLENGNDLENKCYNGYMKCMRSMLKDTNSFNDYWSKIYEKIKGFKKIYISLDGIYYKINPETFLMPDGRYLKEVQEIFQVNSTKDLISGFFQKQQETNIYNSAELFGNPTFDLPLATLKEKEKKYEMAVATGEQNSQTESDRGLLLKPLPGTEKEISDIENFLKNKKWEVKSYIKDEAIKAAIKSVHSPRVLHIATHGLFLSDVKKDSGLTYGLETKRIIENPLLRSGLFFAGAANNKNNDEFYPTGEDNGFLTAYEAMNLDLENTELVVLSACETGLGEIKNGEGVFGLRRAFQQAGAKTVIMTLWKVFDTPTQEMMT